MNATTTKPARVLTVEQREELWELFCSYGDLRSQAETEFWARFNEDAQQLRREADDVQERFCALIWSLTEIPS